MSRTNGWSAKCILASSNRTVIILLGLFSAWCPSSAQTTSVRQPGVPAQLSEEESYARFPELMRLKRWSEAAAMAEELHRRNAQDPRALYWLGISQLQLHNPIAAAQALRSAEKLGLNTALSHEDLGLAYYDLNQFFLFEEQMKKAAQLGPADSKPHYYLGLYRLTIRSDPARALEQFEKAMELQPDDWKSVYQAGYCLEQLGKIEGARERYANAITLVEKAGVPFGWPYQGIARLLLNDQPQDALKFAEKAVALQAAEYSNHLLLAKVYERLGQIDKATHEAKIAADQNPTDSSARYTLYKLYRQAGDPQAAKELKRFEEIRALYGDQ